MYEHLRGLKAEATGFRFRVLSHNFEGIIRINVVKDRRFGRLIMLAWRFWRVTVRDSRDVAAIWKAEFLSMLLV